MIENTFENKYKKVLRPTYKSDKQSTNQTVVTEINSDQNEHIDIIKKMANLRPIVEQRENDEYNAWLLARENEFNENLREQRNDIPEHTRVQNLIENGNSFNNEEKSEWTEINNDWLSYQALYPDEPR